MHRNIALATFAAFGLASVLSAETQRPPTQTPPAQPAQTPPPAPAPARSDVDARVTVMGCLERDTPVAAAPADPPRGTGDTTSRQAAQQAQQGTPQTTFKLTRFEMKEDLTVATVRRGGGSAGTGTTGMAQGRSAQEIQKSTELAVQAAAGSTVDFAAHVNHKVELTGTLEKWDMAATMTGSSATGTTGSSAGRAAGVAADQQRDKPTLSVRTLNMIATSCTGK